MSNQQGESKLESTTLGATPAPEGVDGLLSLLLEQWDEQAIDSSLEPEEQAVATASQPESEAMTSIASINASVENLSRGEAPVSTEAVEQEQFRHDLGQLLDNQETSLTTELSEDLEEQQIVLDKVAEESLVLLFDSIPLLDGAKEIPAESEPVAEARQTIEEESAKEASSNTSQYQIEPARIIPLEPSILFAEPAEESVELSTIDAPSQHENVVDDAALDNLFQSLLGSTEPEIVVPSLDQIEAEGPSSEPISAEADLLGSLLAGMADKEVTLEKLASHPQPSAREIGPPSKFVIFRLAEQVYAIPMQRVLETDRMPRVTFVPGLPSSLRGITNLRGDILPIVDLRQLFGLGETELTAGHRLLIVKSNDNSQVGLIVDALGGLGTFGIDRSPDLQQIENQELKQLLNGCGEHKGQTVNVLDLDKVFTVTELQELAA